jgi:hypothetical protein
MGDAELPEDRVAPAHRAIESFPDGLLAGEDILRLESDDRLNLDKVAEAQARGTRPGGLGA